VEIVEETQILGGVETKDRDHKVIKAKSDSDAYLQAYNEYCIALKVNKDMNESIGELFSKTVGFKLINEDGIDISKSTFFANKEKRENEIKESIFSMGNVLDESIEDSQKPVKIDSAKIKELNKNFKIKKDEFSNNDKKWYIPKTAPQYTDMNGIYCYFQTEKGVPSNFRLRIQYFANDWLFFKKIQFSIDGKAFEFIPDDTETDSGNGGYIWEWCDQMITGDDKNIIHALSNAKNAKMKLIGRQYYKIKNITQQQISSIKQTIDLYNALGGKF
jgi:hypothetical protein